MSNLQVYLPMTTITDGVVSDQSGAGRNGTVQGTVTEVPDSKFGACLQFDGSTGYINFGDILDFGDDPFSASVWFQAERSTGKNILFEKNNLFVAAVKGGHFNYAISPYWAWRENGDLPKIEVGQWYYATVVYTKSEQIVYINGIRQYSIFQTGDIGNNSRNFTVGCRYGTTQTSYFQGKMVHLKIYNKVLTSEEIRQDMNNLELYSSLDDISDSNQIRVSPLNQSKFGPVDSSVNIVPDSKFGTCLEFDGNSGNIPLINVNELGLVNSSFSIGVWVYHYGGAESVILGMDSRGTRQSLHLVIRNNKPFFGFYGHDLNNYPNEPINANEWYHLCFIYDKQSKEQKIYLNGVNKATIGARNPFIGTETLFIGKHWSGYMDGRLTHLKIYNKALTPEEVKTDMVEIEDAYSAFRHTSPLALALYDETEHNRLYINDDTSEDTQHHLHVALTNQSEEGISIIPYATPGVDHHFELRFRAGVLHDTLKNTATLRANFDQSDWEIRYSTTNVVSEPDAILFEYIGDDGLDLLANEELQLIINDIHAAADGGSRSTGVELNYQGINYTNDMTTTLEGTTRTNLEIVNHTGKKNIPLHIGVVGAANILNDGHTENSLRLRITNTSKDTVISLRPKDAHPDDYSRFIIAFESGNDAWDIGANVSTINLAASNTDLWDTNGTSTSNTLELWAKVGNEAFEEHGSGNYFADFDMSKIVTSAPSGTTHIHVQYRNISGYWDGEVIIPITKGPLVEKGDKVGIGTNDPKEALEVNGNIKINASNDNHTRYLQIKSEYAETRIFSHTDGVTYFQTEGDAYFGANSINKRNRPHLYIKTNGNVGIGTNDPISDSKLHVKYNTEYLGLFESDSKNASIRLRPSNNESKDVAITNRDGSAAIWLHEVGDALFIKSDNGNVGIGTIAPSARLNIVAGGEDKQGNVINTMPDQNGIYVHNPNTEAGQHAIICARVNGGDAGDPFLSFDIEGVSGWSIGIDNNDEDKLKIANHWEFTKPGAANTFITFESNGNVGIGTTNPDYKLHIDNGGLKVNNNGVNTTLSGVNNGSAIYGWLGTRNNYPLRLGTNDFAKVTILTNGNVGIGTTNPQDKLETRGTQRISMANNKYVQMYIGDEPDRGGTEIKLFFKISNSIHGSDKIMSWDGDANWDSESDMKLKTNIENEVGILERLLKLDVKNYHWKDKTDAQLKSIGFIAQDVKPLFPALVGENRDPQTKETSLTLKYASFGVLAVGGLKELALKYNQLEQRIDRQEKSIEKLSVKIKELANEKS